MSSIGRKPGPRSPPITSPSPDAALHTTVRLSSNPPVGSMAHTFEMLASESTPDGRLQPWQPEMGPPPPPPTTVRRHSESAATERPAVSPNEHRIGIQPWQPGMGPPPPPPSGLPPPLYDCGSDYYADEGPAPIPPPRRRRSSNGSRESSLKSMGSGSSLKSMQSDGSGGGGGCSGRAEDGVSPTSKGIRESRGSRKSLQSNGSGGSGGGSGRASATSRGMRESRGSTGSTGSGEGRAGGAERRQCVPIQHDRHPTVRPARTASLPGERLTTPPARSSLINLDLPEGWCTVETAKGEIFYVDTINKITCWEHPANQSPRYASAEAQKFFEGSDL